MLLLYNMHYNILKIIQDHLLIYNNILIFLLLANILIMPFKLLTNRFRSKIIHIIIVMINGQIPINKYFANILKEKRKSL